MSCRRSDIEQGQGYRSQPSSPFRPPRPHARSRWVLAPRCRSFHAASCAPSRQRTNPPGLLAPRSNQTRISCSLTTAMASGRFDCIAVLESTTARAARVSPPATPAIRSGYPAGMADPIIYRIEAFRCSHGPLFAERRNRGYTLYIPCRLRSAGRQVSAGWTGRSCRSSLLVALEAAMDQRWPPRTRGSIARSRPRIHRLRGYLLDRHKDGTNQMGWMAPAHGI